MSHHIESAHEIDEFEGRHGSLENLTPVVRRASNFGDKREVSAFPRVWGRESQSGYKGRRVLGLYGDEKANGPYAPELTDPGRHQFLEYELPQRYAGKQEPYRGDVPIPLAGNNNSWAPPASKQKRLCGLGKWSFWLVIIILCLVVLCGAIGGMVVGIESSARKAQSLNTNSYATSTDVSSATKTMTMANGIVVVTTQAFTSLKTIKLSTTTSQSMSTSRVSSTATSAPASSTKATSTASPSSGASNQSSSTSPPTSPTSSTEPTSTPSSSGTVLALNCPTLNGTTATTSISNQVLTYTILCNTDFHSGDLQTVNASSILDCYNACAQYTNFQPHTCTGAIFHANLSSVEGTSGNCHLKNDIKMSYSTGVSDTIAAAVLVVGGQSGSVKKRWVGGGLKITFE